MKRYFINQEGDANKFWTIEVLDSVYAVTFGKVGAKGRETRRELKDAATCAIESAKLIVEKQRKGYREIQANEIIPQKPLATYQPMDEELFWEILASFNWKKSGDDEAVMLPVEKLLAALPIEDIFAFEDILAEKLYMLDGEQYAAACYPGKNIDHISGDAFLYDRCSVLCNGQAFYEAVINEPAKWPVGVEFESLLYLAQMAYARRTKVKDYPHSTKLSYETGSNKAGWPSLK